MVIFILHLIKIKELKKKIQRHRRPRSLNIQWTIYLIKKNQG